MSDFIDKSKEIENILKSGGNGGEVVPKLRKTLFNGDLSLRISCIELIADKKIEDMIPDLVELLDDSDSEIRLNSIEALVEVDNIKRHTLEIAKLLQDRDKLVRITAAEALGEIRDMKVLKSLESALKDSSSLVRSYVAEAIAFIQGKKAKNTLTKHLASEDSQRVKISILAALYDIGYHEYLTDLLSQYNSPIYQDRCAIANLIAELRLVKSDMRIVKKFIRDKLKTESSVAVKSSLNNALKML